MSHCVVISLPVYRPKGIVGMYTHAILQLGTRMHGHTVLAAPFHMFVVVQMQLWLLVLQFLVRVQHVSIGV
jgi:hypothetical protein